MPVPHHLVEEHLHAALAALVDAGMVSQITPWELRDGTVIGLRIMPPGRVSPLGIDARPPRDDAVCHPGECMPEDSDLYRLHARLYGDGCTTACLDAHPSVAHFAAVRLGPALAATLMCDVEKITAVMQGAARPLPGIPAGEAPVRALADVLFT